MSVYFGECLYGSGTGHFTELNCGVWMNCIIASALVQRAQVPRETRCAGCKACDYMM